MQVTVYGEPIACTSAVRGADYINLYDGAEMTHSFSGISDFSGYTIEGGEWTAPSTVQDESALEQRIAELEAVIDALVGGETA